MKTNTIKNLLKIYFIENWKRDLFQYLLIVGGISLFANLLDPGYHGSRIEVFVGFIMLFLYPERVFGAFSNTSKSIHYLTIPANGKDKLIANFLLVNIYAVFFTILAVLIGYSISYEILSLKGVANIGPYMGRYHTDELGTVVLSAYTVLSVLFFGGIYFKRKQTIKTISSFVLFLIVVVLLSAFTVWTNATLTLHKGLGEICYSIDHITDRFSVLWCLIIIIASYALSFIRFRETEV